MSITMAIGFFQESVYRFAYFFSIIPKKLLTKMSRRKSSFWKSFYILTRNALFITRTSQQKIDLRIPCEFGHSATYSQQTGQFSRVSPCLQWQEMHPTTLINTNSLENERMERCITFMCLTFTFHNMYYYNLLWLSYECGCLHALSLCIKLL